MPSIHPFGRKQGTATKNASQATSQTAALTADSTRSLSLSYFILLATVLNMVLYHAPLYRYAIDNLEVGSLNGIITILTLLIVVLVVSTLLLSVLGIISPYLLKLFCMLAALLNACALYFMVTYSIMLDRTMMGNIFNTRSEELLDFMHAKLFLYILILGVLPAWLIYKVRISPIRRLRLLLQITTVVIVGLICIYLASSTWLWVDKHAKYLGGRILPWSYISNTIRFVQTDSRDPNDLTLLPAATLANNDQMLVVLVIGETARAQNFSLYGYERETNPILKESDVAVLRGTKSCSTYTTASLHCILSHSGKLSGSDEPLPSYLQRHGVDVSWRTNNWGEPPLNVGTYQNAGELQNSCVGDYCKFDDVLLSNLEQKINGSSSQKTFITLHTKGSHGPSYFSRYPAQFDVFKPACQSVDLNNCNSNSLVNAYDNTILYTDDFLGRAIKLLDEMPQIPSVLIYISDHGESLGEYGLYLHGTPYSIAPDVQKDIPFIVWMSDKFESSTGISIDDLEHPESHSHNQIFHSILGALGVTSEVYKPELDIFSRK